MTRRRTLVTLTPTMRTMWATTILTRRTTSSDPARTMTMEVGVGTAPMSTTSEASATTTTHTTKTITHRRCYPRPRKQMWFGCGGGVIICFGGGGMLFCNIDCE
eukprot:Rmarinus@m.9733